MAIREYIGARYVPKFYDDGQGGAEWTSTVEYEPLTVVIHNGISYTSRQFVPVGADIEDTTYWLETGQWNSQVEQYRQEVLRFDGRITANENGIEDLNTETAALSGRINAEETARTAADETLAGQIEAEASARTAADSSLSDQISAVKNTLPTVTKIKNVLFIGDSWLVSGRNLYTRITETGVFETTYRQAESGAGFVAGGLSTGKNFNQLLTTIAGTQSETIRNGIDRIVVVGGINDRNSTEDAIVNAIGIFASTAKTYYPNAKVMIGGCNLKNFYSGARSASNMILRAYSRCGRFGCVYITNSEYMGMNSTWDGDGAHLTDSTNCAYNLIDGILNGSFEAAFRFTGTIVDNNGQSRGSCYVWINNSATQYYVPFMAMDIRQDGAGVTVGYNTLTRIGRWTYPEIVGTFEYHAVGMLRIGSNTWKATQFAVIYNPDGTIDARVIAPEGLTVSNVESITILQESVCKNTMM